MVYNNILFQHLNTKQVACVRNLHKSSRVIEALSNNASMLKIDDNKIRFGIESIP